MMPELISSSTRRAILGLGTTGRSVARFWKARGIPLLHSTRVPSLPMISICDVS